MSVVVIVLLIATIVATVALLAAMAAKDKPLYGMIACLLLLGPGAVLTFAYVGLGNY